MKRTLLVAAALALSLRTAAADCALSGLQTTVITKQDAEIVGDGGLLVAATSVNQDTSDKSPGRKPGWRIRAGRALVAPKIDTIAPGLFVYRVPFTSQTTPVEIEDEQHVVVGRVIGSKAKVAVYPAPQVTKVVYASTASRHASQYVTATLDAAPPAGTYALVIADARGTPMAWSPVAAGARAQTPYVHRDCGMVPDGTVEPRPGDTVTLFWVSSEGRVSERSKPLKVGGKPNPY